MAFDSADGTRLLLQRLASSPLVRKTLPNAAAICQQYFSFRRNPSETIGNFLVRETLVHEEFMEAIIRLHEEKMGISQESRDFGLSMVEEEQWWDRTYYDYFEDDDDDAEPHELGPQAGSAPGDGDSRAPRPPEGPTGATGSSPSHHPASLREAAAGPSAGSPDAGGPPQTIDELVIADSFGMGVLRGWRLLQAAGLTAEEKRDILSTTKNSLDYESISAALQSLWDDQLLSQRVHRTPGELYHNFVDQSDDNDAYYQDTDDWWSDADGWWCDGYYQDSGGNDWWEDDGWSWGAYDHNLANEAEDPETTEKLKEAQQAEQLAETLALEANRTWADAQRATQALRKDRGFGISSTSSASAGGIKCYLCGGNHFARECPDRRHPGYKGYNGGKSKDKFKDYLSEYEDLQFTSKGKFRGKGKGKNGL